MGNLLIIIFAFLAFASIGVLLWVLFSAKRAPNRKEEPAPNVAMIRVRSAVPGKTVVEIYSDDLYLDGPAPFDNELNDPIADREETPIERWRRNDLSPEEREALAEELRSLGYTVEFNREGAPEEPAEEGTQAPAPAASAMDFNFPKDPKELLAIVDNVTYPEEVRKEARHRLDKFFESTGAPEGDGDGEDSDDHTGEDGQGTDGEPAEGEFEVDPVTGAPVFRSEAPAAEPVPEDIREVDESYIVTLDFPHEDHNEPDDDRDSRLAIELMKFIAHSFRKGLVDPELVDFAERRLNLKVNHDWTEEEKARVVSRKDEFHYLDNKTIEEFDAIVRASVEEREGRAKSDDSAPKPKAVNLGFDPNGGKNDLLWQRLEALDQW